MSSWPPAWKKYKIWSWNPTKFPPSNPGFTNWKEILAEIQGKTSGEWKGKPTPHRAHLSKLQKRWSSVGLTVGGLETPMSLTPPLAFENTSLLLKCWLETVWKFYVQKQFFSQTRYQLLELSSFGRPARQMWDKPVHSVELFSKCYYCSSYWVGLSLHCWECMASFPIKIHHTLSFDPQFWALRSRALDLLMIIMCASRSDK